MAGMIKSVIVDVGQTFDGPLVFLGCEQKMVRVDKKDASSPMVADVGKWTVAIMARVRSDDGSKVARENINVTMESTVNPCSVLEEFDKVQVTGLQYNVMTSERGAAMVFWRVKTIRAAAAGANGTAAHVSAVPANR